MNATKSTLTKAILVLAIILIFVQSGFAAEVDCGLRGYDGSAIVKFGCDAAASTPLKISKNGTTYNVLLVPTNDPYATKFRIQTQSQGIKALKKYNPIVCGNNTCETGENCSTCVADCGCNTSAGYYCSSGTCINHFGNGVCESSLSETCLNTPDCACSSGLTCISGSCLWLTWKGGAIQTSLLYCTGNGCYIGAGNSPCSTYGAVCEMCVSEGIFPEYNCGYGPDGFYCDTTWVQRYQFQRFICS